MVPVLMAEALGVGLAEEGLKLGSIGAGFQLGQLVRFDHPARLAEEGVGIDRSSEDVQHAAVGRAKVAGDISALLLTGRNAKRTDFLEAGHVMGAHILADLFIGEGAHPERFGVVSGEPGILEMARDVEQEHQLAGLPGPLEGCSEAALERDGRPAETRLSGAWILRNRRLLNS